MQSIQIQKEDPLDSFANCKYDIDTVMYIKLVATQQKKLT